MKPDWLAQLAPAHAPPPPGWWPLAPGWWGVATLLAIALALVVYWQTRPSVRLRRIALRELDELEASSGDDMTFAQSIEHLLRRFAVARFGHDDVANLSGERWIAFVVAHGGNALSGAAGTNLLLAAYGGKANDVTTAHRTHWLSGARAFIKGRRK
ncbi:MAG: DUF4381 domain-containing protein [Georgfuchsia sp.]